MCKCYFGVWLNIYVKIKKKINFCEAINIYKNRNNQHFKF